MLYGLFLFNLSEFSVTVDNPKQLLLYSLLYLRVLYTLQRMIFLSDE